MSPSKSKMSACIIFYCPLEYITNKTMPTITNRIPNPASVKRRKVLGVTPLPPFTRPATGGGVPSLVVVGVGPTSVGATVGEGVGLGVGDGVGETVGEGVGVEATVIVRMPLSITASVDSLSAITLTE